MRDMKLLEKTIPVKSYINVNFHKTKWAKTIEHTTKIVINEFVKLKLNFLAKINLSKTR